MEVVQFCVGLYDLLWHGLHVQDRGEDDTSLYLSIFQDGVMKIHEWYHFNPSHVIFQHDNDPKDDTKLVK